LLKKVAQRGRRRAKTGGVAKRYAEDFGDPRTKLEAFFQQPDEGAWCSTASTSVSKTEGLGSIPSAPAIMNESVCRNLATERSMFKKMWDSTVEFINEVKSEFRKISFPTTSETLGSTTVVIVFCIIMSLYLSVVDSFLVWLVGKII
jgi:preprotein translocase subunit SecE